MKLREVDVPSSILSYPNFGGVQTVLWDYRWDPLVWNMTIYDQNGTIVFNGYRTASWRDLTNGYFMKSNFYIGSNFNLQQAPDSFYIRMLAVVHAFEDLFGEFSQKQGKSIFK